MNKKTIFQIVLLVALFGIAGWLVARFFKPEKIQILCDIHPPRASRPGAASGANRPPFDVAFGFDQRYALTDIKVVVADEWATNKRAQPLWHLITESNSVPTKQIVYGQGVRGMHPTIKGMRAKLLETNVTYRLLIEAGSREGECDFKLPVSH
ncbi:MAG: hypothetical protein WDM76_08225 [Limisphaerales bacterium]